MLSDYTSETTFIYALVDPLTKFIRYVGKSSDPYARYVEHLQEKGNSAKNLWLQSLLAKGLKPALLILEEVPLYPPYIWQEKEKWWIAFLKQQGALLTNIVSSGDEATSSILTGVASRKRSWKGHKQLHSSTLGVLLAHTHAEREDLPSIGNGNIIGQIDLDVLFTNICDRFPTGTTVGIYGSDISTLKRYVTWFTKCKIIVKEPLPLGLFPIDSISEDGLRKTTVYPVQPGEYESWIWKEQVLDCLNAGCEVSQFYGDGWEEWTADNKPWLALCNELMQQTSIREAVSMSQNERKFLYNLAHHEMQTPPYPKMFHWFTCAIMQYDRSLYHAALKAGVSMK